MVSCDALICWKHPRGEIFAACQMPISFVPTYQPVGWQPLKGDTVASDSWAGLARGFIIKQCQFKPNILTLLLKSTGLKKRHFFNQHYQLISDMGSRIGIDSGMVVVIFISLMYLTIVFGMLFYVKNDWCDLLFKNFTESIIKNMSISMFPISDNFEYVSSFF